VLLVMFEREERIVGETAMLVNRRRFHLVKAIDDSGEMPTRRINSMKRESARKLS
jgi:hypothetical protein